MVTETQNRKLSLENLVKALQQQNYEKRDFVVNANRITMTDGKLVVVNNNSNPELAAILKSTGISSGESLTLQPLEHCHTLLANRLDIPKVYYNKVLEASPSLLDANVNYWLMQSKSNYYLRTFVNDEKGTGFARAILSDRYFTLDNYDVLLAALEAIRESGLNIGIESADITDKNMFVRFTNPEIELQAPELLKNYKVPGHTNRPGHTGIISGFVISNSEVGAGGFSVKPRATILACNNGMTRKDEAFNRIHLGAKMDELTSVVWSEDTKQKNLALICSQIKDAIKTFASREYLGRWIEDLTKLNEAAGELSHPTDAVRNVSKEYGFGKEKEASILNYFIKGADTSAFGISQAITYYAHKDASADEQYELEEAADHLLKDAKGFDKRYIEVKRGPKPKVNPALN